MLLHLSPQLCRVLKQEIKKSYVCATHRESGKGLWLRGKAAFRLHSLRDTEPQPVIQPNAKKNHRISPKALRLCINVSFKPQTTVYQAKHGILLTSVMPKAVTVDLEI